MKIDGDMAEILGIHVGDGCISVTDRYSEYYLGGDLKEEKEYHDNWVAPLFNKKVMLPVCKKEVVYKEHPKVGVYGFYIFNKRIVDFFGKLGINPGSKINIRIPSAIVDNDYLSKRFLRGLFDTDGSIYFDKNYSAKKPKNDKPKIKLGTVSKGLSQDVFKVLKNLGMNPFSRKPYQGKRNKNKVYNIVLYRKDDIQYFIDKIGFRNPKHVTKWMVFKKLKYCPPNTTLIQRREILDKKV